MTAHALRLRKMQPADAWLSSQRQVRWHATLNHNEDAIPCELALCQMPAPSEHDLRLATDHGEVSWHAAELLCVALGGLDLAFACTEAQRQALWNASMARWPTDLLRALGHPVLLASGGAPADRNHYALSLQCQLNDCHVGMRLSGSSSTLQALLIQTGWRAMPTEPSLSLEQIPWALPIVMAQPSLTHAEFCQLERGDVIRLPGANFSLAGQGIVITPFSQLVLYWNNPSKTFVVQEVVQKEVMEITDTTNQACQLDELPIQLTITLGTVNLSLGKLQALAPGAVLSLNRGLPPQVQVQVNGVVCGQGELIELAGELAVQLTEWPNNSPTS